MAVACSRGLPCEAEGHMKSTRGRMWLVRLVTEKLPGSHGTPQSPERKSHRLIRGLTRSSHEQGERLTAAHQAMAGAGRSRELSRSEARDAGELACGSYFFLWPDGQRGSSEEV